MSDFDPAQFAELIPVLVDVMKMGMPKAVEMRPTFGWEPVKTYVSVDSAGQPWSMSSAPATTTTRPEVQVPCAVEYLDAAGEPIETPIGDFNPDQARVTLLQAQYDLVCPGGVKFDYVKLGGTKFLWVKELPVLGLFEAHQIVVATPDKS